MLDLCSADMTPHLAEGYLSVYYTLLVLFSYRISAWFLQFIGILCVLLCCCSYCLESTVFTNTATASSLGSLTARLKTKWYILAYLTFNDVVFMLLYLLLKHYSVVTKHLYKTVLGW